jgi:hypothetical protein
MPGHVTAALMVRETTRRRLTEPSPARRRTTRRVGARALRAAANRREPVPAAQPRTGV